MGGLGQLAAFVERVRERLLAIDVLAGADGGHGGHGMDVVGRADADRVDVIGLLVEHDAEVFVAPGLGEIVKRAGSPLFVDVAEGDDVGAVLGVGGDVAAAHAAGADAGQVDTLAGRNEAGPAEHVPRHDQQAQAGTCRDAKKIPP